MHFEETLTIAKRGCRSVIGSQCVYSFSFDVASNPSNYSHSLLHIFYSNRMEFVCFALSKFIRWKWIRYDKKQNFPLPDDMTDQRSIKKTMLMDEIRIIAGRKCDQQWAEFCGIRYKSTEIMYINFICFWWNRRREKKNRRQFGGLFSFPCLLVPFACAQNNAHSLRFGVWCSCAFHEMRGVLANGKKEN